MGDSRRRAALGAWVLVVLDATLIYYGSSIEKSHLPRSLSLLYNFDKPVHMLEYGIFGWLVTRALAKSRDFTPLALALLSLALGCLYAATDEWHQYYVPMRDFSFFDWMADAAGVSAGIAIWLKRKVSPHARH